MPRSLTLCCIAILLLIAPALLAQAPASQADPGEEFTTYVFFGQKYFALNEISSAYEQFVKADQIHPDQPAIIYNLGLLLAKLGRYPEAQVKIDRYMQLYPAGAEMAMVKDLQLEVQFLRDRQKKRQAEHDYREMVNRGKFLFQKGDLDEALKAFQRAEEVQPDDPAVIYNEAAVYEQTGDFVKATELLRRYTALDTADKPEVDQKIFALESEITDMRTKIVCPFCGNKIPIGATWCQRCWHGPYLTSSPVWNSRPCVAGATATRSSYYADGRVSKNEDLPCLQRDGAFLTTVRYTPRRQDEIQAARRAEGWIYAGDVLQSKTEDNGKVVLEQGDYLQRAVSTSTGEIVTYSAHQSPDGFWLLDAEDFSVDGQQYHKDYRFDAQGKISQEVVRYQNVAACSHLITMTADYTYDKDVVTGVHLNGAHDGYPVEGSPHTEWDGTIVYTYNASGRLEKEEFLLGTYQKTYAKRAIGTIRDELQRLDPSARPKKPSDIRRSGDQCAMSGTTILGNPIDLRPLYTLSPNLAIQLPNGVNKVTVSFTYPDTFAIAK
jgi:Tetratricopeptide repeat.